MGVELLGGAVALDFELLDDEDFVDGHEWAKAGREAEHAPIAPTYQGVGVEDASQAVVLMMGHGAL
jgi:hypothetical protein